MNRASRSLTWKIIGINAAVSVLTLAVIGVAVHQYAGQYFLALAKQYSLRPLMMYEMFLAAVDRYFLWGTILALALGTWVNVAMTRRALRPLTEMTDLTRKVAAGNYAERLPVAPAGGGDEISQLAQHFNQMVDSLQRIEQLRRDLVANVGHELRTPLTKIKGYTEALKDGVLPATAERLELLHRHVNHLSELVDGLRQLTQVESEMHRPGPAAPVDLRGLTGEILAVYRGMAGEKGLTISLSGSDGPWPVLGRRAPLLQVVRNLIDNAVQYTPAGGEITIRADSHEANDPQAGAAARWRWSITNTGPGIDAADLPHVFERFYRSEQSRSRKGGGAGIGLAIVREVIEAHGGTVGARSIPGEQTEFWFELAQAPQGYARPVPKG